MTVDVTDRVQRMEALEDRLEVELEAISAKYGESTSGDTMLWVFCDVVSASGTFVNMWVNVSAYNESGQLVGVEKRFLEGAASFGIVSTQIGVNMNGEAAPAKVRLYVSAY